MSFKNDQLSSKVEVIGHRGHVSNYPENSTEGFLSAIALGVDGLEMDLVISGDRQVVVSHEPYMKSTYMLTPDGKRITKSREKELNLYKMSYDSIRKFDSGSMLNQKFRRQKRFQTLKPLLKDVLDTVESTRTEKASGIVKYYLEIKSNPEDYGVFQPRPDDCVELVMRTIIERNLQENVIIMSFDAAVLNVLKEGFPEVKASYLWYKKGIEESLRELNFTPEAVGPWFKQLKNRETVASLQKRGIKVIPWTVNTKKQIREMINLGVDGIISDYPERVLEEKEK